MPTEDPSLEGAPEAEAADHPPAAAEPGAADKSGDDAGAANQDSAEPTTPETPPESEPSLTEELLGQPQEPKDDPPPAADAQAAADPPPQDQIEQKTPEAKAEAQPEKDQKPAEDDGDKPLAPEQERATPKFARRRIKNLERELEHRTAALREMEARAVNAGYQKAEDVLDAIDTFGRAIHKRDPQALADLDRRLQEAGLKREAPAPAGLPPDKVRALLKAYAYDELEKLVESAEAESAKPAQQDAKPPPAQHPPAKPDAQQRQRQPEVHPEVAQAAGAMQALADEVRAQHGDAAQEILAEIADEVQKAHAKAQEDTGFGLRPAKWVDVFRSSRDAVVARRRDQAKRTPPKALRPSSSASNRSSQTPLTDELLET